jgi:membrane protein YqaA with SNARE-associated domain
MGAGVHAAHRLSARVCLAFAVVMSVDAPSPRGETILAVVRILVSLAILLGIVTLVGWLYRAELTHFGAWFVRRFGVAGMIGGAFLADGFHLPLPPQFYLLTGIAGAYPHAVVVAAVLVGSELGGLTAFALARLVGGASFVDARIAKPRALLRSMIAKRGYFGLALATLLPISYSILCIATGAMRLPYRAYGVLAVMRVPRILLSYVVIVLAWE